MNRTKFLKGECQHCGGHLEFPAEIAGLPADCPHCGQQTDLLLAAPPQEPTVPRRTIVWAVIGIVILGLGLGGALVALKRAERWAARQKRQSEESLAATAPSTPPAEVAGIADPQAQNGFAVSAAELEKAPGTSLVYAVGTLKNTSNHKRFGVKVELDLFDASEQKVGMATDYQQVMETNATWRFKALVVDSRATTAKVATIKEDQ
jgi:hypothetical protein